MFIGLKVKGHLLQAAAVSQADHGHAQLLADAVQLSLGLLRQGAGGLVQHWHHRERGQNNIESERKDKTNNNNNNNKEKLKRGKRHCGSRLSK